MLIINPLSFPQPVHQSDAFSALDGFHEYEVPLAGKLLVSITVIPKALPLADTGPTHTDPCADVVPTHLTERPLDPTSGLKSGSTAYAGGSDIYPTTQSISNRCMVAAPSAQSITIDVTR